MFKFYFNPIEIQFIFKLTNFSNNKRLSNYKFLYGKKDDWNFSGV